MNKLIMMRYLDNKIPLMRINSDECLEVTYMLLEATLPLINKVIRNETNPHLSGIYQSAREEIEAAMEAIET